MNATGPKGEAYTREKLAQMEFRVICSNYRSRLGEIDIIAENGQYIVFVEVKARSAGSLSAPREAVSRAKRRKIVKAALCYLAEHPTRLQPRFDVAEVRFSAAGAVVGFAYYENAFIPEDGYAPF